MDENVKISLTLFCMVLAFLSCKSDEPAPPLQSGLFEVNLLWETEVEGREDFAGGFFRSGSNLLCVRHNSSELHRYFLYFIDEENGTIEKKVVSDHPIALGYLQNVHDEIVNNKIIVKSNDIVHEIDVATGDIATTEMNRGDALDGIAIEGEEIYRYKNTVPDETDTFHYELSHRRIGTIGEQKLAVVQSGNSPRRLMYLAGEIGDPPFCRQLLFVEDHYQTTNRIHTYELHAYDVKSKQFTWEMPNIFGYSSLDEDKHLIPLFLSVVDKNPSDLHGLEKDYLLATFNKKLICVDLVQKAIKWERNLTSLRPLQFGSRIIVSNSNEIEVLNLKTGEPIYRKSGMYNVGYGYISENILYFTGSESVSEDNKLYAVDLASKEIKLVQAGVRLNKTVNGSPNDFLSRVHVIKDNVFVGDHSHIYCFRLKH